MWDIEEELTRFVLNCQAIPNWKVIHSEEVLFVHRGQELPVRSKYQEIWGKAKIDVFLKIL